MTLLVGPISGVVSGQSVAFRESGAAIPSAVMVDADFSSARKLLTFPFRLLRGVYSSRGPVYFTSSRSYKGFYARDLLVFLLTWLSRRKLINHLHGSDFSAFRSGVDPLTGLLVDWCYRRVHLSIAPSARALKQYNRYGSMWLEVVENFFDERLSEVSLKKENHDALEVVYLSNLIYTKGYTVAVEACRLLHREGLPVHLTLCGSPIGDNNMSVRDIKKYLEGLVGEAAVSVVGCVRDDAKARVLSEANIFVLPTFYPTEEAPISILEALAAGCYVISTAQGSIPDLLAGFHARVVTPTAEDFARAIREYWGRTDKAQIAIENRERAIKRYSARAYRKKIGQLIESVSKDA